MESIYHWEDSYNNTLRYVLAIKMEIATKTLYEELEDRRNKKMPFTDK